jgi:hypothetical protein
VWQVRIIITALGIARKGKAEDYCGERVRMAVRADVDPWLGL